MPRKLFPQDGQLPDDVLGELVDMMFTALAPVIVMGVTTVGMAVLFASLTEGLAFPALALCCSAIASARVGIILAYRRRRAAPPLSSADIRLWESRYAWASYAFAAVLGLLNLLALLEEEPLAHMLVVGLTFGYGAGLATRTAVRPPSAPSASCWWSFPPWPGCWRMRTTSVPRARWSISARRSCSPPSPSRGWRPWPTCTGPPCSIW
ncbi:hypothetical protein ACFQU7_16155 [Pseudoroseomonas wenyumeiae]